PRKEIVLMNDFTSNSRPEAGRSTDSVVVAVGNTAIDVRAEPDGPRTGSKQPARVDIALSGNPVHIARTAVANGLTAAVIAAQKAGWPAEVCRGQAAAEGIRMLLQERDEQGPAMSIIVPNTMPGNKDIYTQWIQPPTVGELTPEMQATLSLARVVFVSPLPWNADPRDLLFQVPVLFREAFLALLPPPSLLADPVFPLLARRYHYVQANA